MFKIFNIAFTGLFLSGAAFAETITIHGSTTVNSNLFEPYKTQIEEKTGLTLNVISNGSSRGIKGIDTGNADIGMISSDLSSVLSKLKIEDRVSEFQSETIGEERIIFAVHPSNNVSELSKEQVISILQGSITNWSEVGGTNMPIIVVTEYSGGGFRTTVEKKLLNKQPITIQKLKELPNGSQVAKVGQQIKPALVVVPSNMVKGYNLKKLNTDAEIIQPLNLVIKGEKTLNFNKIVEVSKELLSN